MNLGRIIKRRSAFTLSEVMMALTIFLIISAGVICVFLVGKRAWIIGTARVSVQEAARYALERMKRELIFSRSTLVSIAAADDLITLRIPANVDGNGNITWSNDIQYSLANGQIIRTFNTQSTVLANNIQSLQFVDLGGQGVEIRIIAQRLTTDGRNIVFALSSQVYFRNG